MKTQRGAALLMGLLLLLVLTLLAVSAVNLSTINLRIVSNMQASKQGEAAIDQAMATVLSDPTNFTTNKATTLNIPIGDAIVTVEPRICLYSESLGDTSSWATPGELALWQVTATYQHPLTRTQTTITRGVRIVMQGNGNCL